MRKREMPKGAAARAVKTGPDISRREAIEGIAGTVGAVMVSAVPVVATSQSPPHFDPRQLRRAGETGG